MNDPVMPAPLPGLRPLRLLLIDDNPRDRELLIRELQKRFAPLTILPVRDEREFDSALAQGSFDAVVLDYLLCWTTALHILPKIKRARPDCPVLMFTASCDRSECVAGWPGVRLDRRLDSWCA